MKGIYKFSTYRFDKEALFSHCDCEILDETAKRYKIKLLAPNVYGHRYGDVIWVSKSKVQLPCIPNPTVDCSSAWWQNL